MPGRAGAPHWPRATPWSLSCSSRMVGERDMTLHDVSSARLPIQSLRTTDGGVRRNHARLCCYPTSMHVFLRKLAFTFGFAGVVGALVIVAVQGVAWLEFGTWPQVTVIHGLVALGLRPPTSTWPIIQNLIDMGLEIPLSVLTLVIGVGLRGLFRSLAARCRPKFHPRSG
jgi:hypothetical protein